jgi:hypothetical protein
LEPRLAVAPIPKETASDMTSDGISDADWDRVHTLAVQIANASTDVDSVTADELSIELHVVLDDLESKYGPLPSILATRADYTDDAVDAVKLLERAYEAAVARGDRMNRVEIAESLAQMHVEHLQDLHGAIRWLAAFAEELGTSPAPDRVTELRRLEAHLRLSAPSPDKVPVLVFHGEYPAVQVVKALLEAAAIQVNASGSFLYVARADEADARRLIASGADAAGLP